MDRHETGARVATLQDRALSATAERCYSRPDYPKARFPSAAVYGSTGRPELRLITCTGAFAHGHYRGNLVVFAHEPLRRAAAKPATKANPTMTAATRPAGKPAAEKRATVHQQQKETAAQ